MLRICTGLCLMSACEWVVFNLGQRIDLFFEFVAGEFAMMFAVL